MNFYAKILNLNTTSFEKLIWYLSSSGENRNIGGTFFLVFILSQFQFSQILKYFIQNRFVLPSQLMSNNHHIPNIPLPQQPEIHHGAEAIALYNSPWEFPRNRVDLQMILGSGAFGLVMKGQAQGIKGCVGKMYVAVKIVKGKALECTS